MDIEYRLRRLEAQNRLLRHLLVLFLVIGVTVFTLRSVVAEGRARRVEATGFDLVGDDGKTYASLGMSQGGMPGLWLNDEAGRTRIRILVTRGRNPERGTSDEKVATFMPWLFQGGAELIMYDPKGTPSAALHVRDDGTASLRLSTTTGGAMLGVTETGDPSLELYEQDAGSLEVHDRLSIGVTELKDRMGGIEKRSAASVVFFNLDGTVCKKLPD